MHYYITLKTMKRFDSLSNSQLSAIIDEWVRGERDRQIMKRRLIDCITLETLAEEFQLSTTQTSKIVAKNNKLLTEKM